MSIGERIKTRRKELGMSAETLAEKIGKSAATVYRYEKGDISGVDSKVLLPIADALGTTPGYLMGWDEIADNLGSDSPAAKKLRAIGEQFRPTPLLRELGKALGSSPELKEMNRAMLQMSPEERQKMVEMGKVLFPDRFKDKG